MSIVPSASTRLVPVPLNPEHEAEIRERIAQLDDDRTFPAATWLASSVNSKSMLPPEQSHVVEDVLQTDSFVTRASVGVFGDKRYAEFTAHARDDIPALLDEIDRLRSDRAAYSAEMTRANADWLEGIGQDHAASMLRYSLELDAEMAAAVPVPDETAGNETGEAEHGQPPCLNCDRNVRACGHCPDCDFCDCTEGGAS